MTISSFHHEWTKSENKLVEILNELSIKQILIKFKFKYSRQKNKK